VTYFCYIDESGTPEVPGTSSHFVLVGFAVPINAWREADRQIRQILLRYDLAEEEIHTAWLLRRMVEQDKISGFAGMSRADRKAAVQRYRAGELLRLRRLPSPKAHNQAKKTYRHTQEYVHLTLDERRQMLDEVAQCVADWDFAVVFAEAIDKLHFDEGRAGRTISEQAFEQIVSRFEQFLVRDCPPQTHGVLVHDNNQTVARKHTDLMRHFHEQGTLWAKIQRLAETPLFVDSKLTRLVQIADLCSYALRRYHENGESRLLAPVTKRVHRVGERTVGARHYSVRSCACQICVSHSPARKPKAKPSGTTAK
jgi:hypothetical protein